MAEFAEDRAKKVNKRNWVSLVPYGLNQQHPNNYRDILDSVWENRDSLGYAFRILSDGCCDGCSLGTSGMHDWTMKGIHLCAVRLQLLRFNTMPAMDAHLFEDARRLRGLSERKLRKLGRLPAPMVRRKGDKGFRVVSWDEAIGLVAVRLARDRSQAPGLVSDLSRAYQRGLLRAPEGRALHRHQSRRYQRPHLPRAQHRRPERHGRLCRNHLLLLRLDRRRSGRSGRHEPGQQSAGRHQVSALRQKGRNQGFRRQSLSRAGAGPLLDSFGHRERAVRHQDRRRPLPDSPRRRHRVLLRRAQAPNRERLDRPRRSSPGAPSDGARPRPRCAASPGRRWRAARD